MTGSTISFSGIIGPGQTLPVALTGTNFYLSVATGALFIRPTGVSPWSQYQPGMGQNCPKQFTQIEVFNGGANAVTFQVFAGYADFIDHRLIANLETKNVVVLPVWKATPNAGYYSNLFDKTGLAIFDMNGNNWIALERTGITVCVFGTVGGSAQNVAELLALPSLAPIFAVTGPGGSATPGSIIPYTLSFSGNIQAYLGNIYNDPQSAVGSIFETYQAIAPGYAGNPPS